MKKDKTTPAQSRTLPRESPGGPVKDSRRRRGPLRGSSRRTRTKGIPALAFAAYSGTGKTTLIERLVQTLKAQGLRIAVIKHDGHDFEIDREGKDSWRFTQAGADISVISSAGKTALVEQRPLSLSQAASMIHHVDLILVEGFKREGLTQIGICRLASGKGFPDDIRRYTAVVTDAALGDIDIPRFGLDDIPELAEFIRKNMNSFTRLNEPGRGEPESPMRRTTAAKTRIHGSFHRKERLA